MAKAKNFIPQLSPQKLRLLRKIFVTNQHSKDLLVKTLENEVKIFEDYNLILKDHPSRFEFIEKEIIQYQTCCSLFADLLQNNWFVNLGVQGFVVSKPDYEESFGGDKKSMSSVKDKMRDIQLVNRNKQISSPETQRFIERMERPHSVGNEQKSILDLIDNGKELAEIFEDTSSLNEEKRISLLKKIIKPELVICYPSEKRFREEEHNCPYTGLKLSDIWRYFRLTWSSEHKSNPGKSFPVLIRNAGRPNKPIIGISMLRSAALADEARDTAIGWHNEEIIREKIQTKKININFVVETLLTCLDEQIQSIRVDDFKFLNKKNIKFPDEDIINQLSRIYDQELLNRIEDLEAEKKSAKKIDMYSEPDWQTESEIPLFRKKRALKLARLLEARKVFNDVEIKNNPARGWATLIHKSNKNGKEMISRTLREVRQKVLNENIMDVGVCGSITPYNEILGGKLVTSLMCSQELRELFRDRYFSKYKSASTIASSNKGKAVYRDADLMCLTTTSLYGVASSQYNRIKFLKKDFPELKENLEWKEIFKGDASHKTKGMGVYHFSDITTKLLGILTHKILKRVEVNNKFGEGTSPKLRQIVGGLRLLIDDTKENIEPSYFLAHSIQRKNYIFYFTDNILNRLMNQSKSYSSINASTSKDITNAWIKRWLIKRSLRKETIDKLKELNFQTIKKSLSISK